MVTPMIQDSYQCSQKAKGLILPGSVGVGLLEVVAPKLACGCDLGPASPCSKQASGPRQDLFFLISQLYVQNPQNRAQLHVWGWMGLGLGLCQLQAPLELLGQNYRDSWKPPVCDVVGPGLQTRRLKPREVKALAPGHIARGRGLTPFVGLHSLPSWLFFLLLFCVSFTTRATSFSS